MKDPRRAVLYQPIVGIRREPLGRGHARIAKLACGHETDVTWRTNYKVGSRTRCEECRA